MKKKKHYPPFEQLAPALNFGLTHHKGFLYLQNLHIDQCYLPILLTKAFLRFVENAKCFLSQELFVVVGIGWEWEGSVINVRVYLLSNVKFLLIFLSCNLLSMPLLYKMKYLQVNKSTKSGLSKEDFFTHHLCLLAV